MITKSSPRPVRVAALIVATCAIGLSAASAAPAVAATPQLSLGQNYSCLMLANETVKCWGQNASGQLGNGTRTSSPTSSFVRKSYGPIGYNATFSQIGAGFMTTCGVASSTSGYQTAGTVECWGDNTLGALGTGSLTPANMVAPGPTGITSGATQVSGGQYGGCALVSGGVKCWGENDYGQVGDGTVTNRYSPVSVSGLTSGVVQVSRRLNFACALLSGGTVKCWGRNNAGQLGNGTTNNGNSGGPGATSTPVSVLNLTGATQISAGGGFACALINDGTVKCWGSNAVAQIGDGTTTDRSSPVTVQNLSNVTQISAGGSFACALINDGTLKCWGVGVDGQLGSVIASPGLATSPVAVTGLSGVTQVASGATHACALASGELKCWGSNYYGELGVATSTSSSATPVSPSGVLPTPPAAPVLSGVPSNPTKLTTASIGFTSTTAGATFQCSIDGGAYTTCTSPRALSGLSDGTHTIAVKALKDGLESTVTSASWVVDTTPPAAPTLSGVPASLTDATHAVIHFNSAGTGITYTCSVDGGPYVDCTSPLELSGLGDGPHSISVKATDAAGNTSTASSASWTVDTTAHTPPYVALISPDLSPTKETTASIEYDGEAGATFLCSLDGGAYEPCPPAPVLLTGLSDGSHTYSVKQLDGAGNASDPSSVTWVVDTTPPAAPSITTKPSATTTSTSATIGFTGTGEPGATFECKIDTGDWGPCPSNPFTLDPVSVGAHTVLVREVDAAGNKGASATVNWTVQSVTPPACSPRPTPPTPTQPVTAIRVRGNVWRMNAGAVFNTGGDTRPCAQILTVQIRTLIPRPVDGQPAVQLSPTYANGIVAWTGANVERASKYKPRWIRVENRIGRWSGWIAVK